MENQTIKDSKKVPNSANLKVLIASAVAIILILIVLIVIVLINNSSSEEINSEETTETSEENISETEQNDDDPMILEEIETENFLYIKNDKIIAQEVTSGELTELRDLSSCLTSEINPNKYFIGDVSRYGSESGSFYVGCGQSVIVASDKKGYLEYDLSDLLETSENIIAAELSKDGQLLALETSQNSRSVKDNRLVIYNIENNSIQYFDGYYSYSPVYEVELGISHFSPDNKYLYASTKVPAGYLSDKVFAYNLESNQRSEVEGISIEEDQQFSATIFAGTDNNVADDGTMYFWSANENKDETIILSLSLNGSSIKSTDRQIYSTKTIAISMADYSNAFSQLVGENVILNSYITVCEVASLPECTDSESASIKILDKDSTNIVYSNSNFDLAENIQVYDYVEGKIYYVTSEFSNNATTTKLYELDTETDTKTMLIDFGKEGSFLGMVKI